MKTSIIALFLPILISCNILQDTDNTTGGMGGRCGPGAETNVLFIGESELEDSLIPQRVLDHACGERMNIAVTVYAPFSYGLQDHSDDSSLDIQLKSNHWDLIIIFEHSKLMRDPSFDFNALSKPALNQLKTKIKNANPDTKIFLAENWSSQTEFENDSDIIQNRYASLSNANNINLIKTNVFWEAIFNDSSKPFPANELWASDTVSPSEIGQAAFSGLIFAQIIEAQLSVDSVREETPTFNYIKDRVNEFSEF